ncbi:50s ribosomal protein l3, partial [Cystoisospora suis]
MSLTCVCFHGWDLLEERKKMMQAYRFITALLFFLLSFFFFFSSPSFCLVPRPYSIASLRPARLSSSSSLFHPFSISTSFSSFSDPSVTSASFSLSPFNVNLYSPSFSRHLSFLPSSLPLLAISSPSLSSSSSSFSSPNLRTSSSASAINESPMPFSHLSFSSSTSSLSLSPSHILHPSEKLLRFSSCMMGHHPFVSSSSSSSLFSFSEYKPEKPYEKTSSTSLYMVKKYLGLRSPDDPRDYLFDIQWPDQKPTIEVLARKVDMTACFAPDGQAEPVTLLQILPATLVEFLEYGKAVVSYDYPKRRPRFVKRPLLGKIQKVGSTGYELATVTVRPPNDFILGQILDVSC